jgi:hypothetical protein
MPNINSINIPNYLPNQPYFWTYDNLPIEAIKQREDLINSAVENNISDLRSAAGDAGSVGNRLAQSMTPTGHLLEEAVNDVNHRISSHRDDAITIDSAKLAEYQILFPTLSNPVAFVKMLDAERGKLSTIAENSNFLQLNIETASNVANLTNTQVLFQNSDTISWKLLGSPSVDDQVYLKAELNSSLSNSHKHYYQVVPTNALVATTSPDYNRVYTTSMTFMEGSLKVYVNGVRLFSDAVVFYPTRSSTPEYKQNLFTPNLNFKGFSLLNAISSDDIIRVDFDVSMV